MSSSSAEPINTPWRSRTARHWEWAGLALLLVGYALYLTCYFVPAFGGTDPNGYHVSARILAETGQCGRVPADDFEFIGRMWVITDAGVAYAKYPPLYPAACGLLIRLGGIGADLWLNPACGLLAVAAMFFVGKGFGLGRWSLAAAGLLALNPVFNLFVVQQVSHASGMCALLWGFAAWLTALRTERPWRAACLHAIAGLLIGCAAGIRYTDALLALPLLADAALRARRRSALPMAATLVGLAMPWGALAWHHTLAFGGPLTTGYALTGEQTGFGLGYFLGNALLYFRGIVESGLGPVTLLVIPGLALLWRQHRRRALLTLLWLLPLLLLYPAYYWAPEDRHVGFLRFLLPVLAPALLLAVMAIRGLAAWPGLGSWPRVLAAGGILLVQGGWGTLTTLDQAEQVRQPSLRVAAAADLIAEHVPDDAIIIANQNLHNYLDYLGRWRLYPDEIFFPNRLRQMTARADDDGPSGLQRKRALWLKENLADLSGREYRGRIDLLLRSHLAADRRIFFAMPPGDAGQLRRQWLRTYELAVVAELDAAMPSPWLPMRSAPRPGRPAPNKANPNLRLTLLELTAERQRPLRPAEEQELLREDLKALQQNMFGGNQVLRGQVQEYERIRQRLQRLEEQSNLPPEALRKDRRHP